MTSELIVGLMSGTSIDGIDAALVRFSSAQKLELIGTEFVEFEQALKDDINTLANFNGEFDQASLKSVDQQLTRLYAKTSLALITKNGYLPDDITAIANHGQTVRHRPNATPPISIQIGNTQSIANLTGIQTIGQFRQGDLAVGGQGAPLMPAFHQAMFASNDKNNRYLLNLGGIANITRLATPNRNQKVVGFDTGPANCLLDLWISEHKQVSYDNNGKWAASGKIIPEILARLLADPYFKAEFPKSTGTDYFNLIWLNEKITNLNSFSPQDVQATLLQLTIDSIHQQIVKLELTDEQDSIAGELFVCGGGAHNDRLVNGLKQALAPLVVRSTEDLGVAPDWLEAIGFAWLGYCHLHSIPSNSPSVTGARKEVVLGQSYGPE